MAWSATRQRMSCSARLATACHAHTPSLRRPQCACTCETRWGCPPSGSLSALLIDSQTRALLVQGRIADAIAAGPEAWSTQQGSPVQESQATKLCISPDCQWAAARLDARLVVWELGPSAREVVRLPCAPSPVSWCYWSACSSTVAFLDLDGCVQLLDVASGACSTASIGCRLVGTCACFLPGGRSLLLPVGASEARPTQVVQLGADGQLLRQECPSRPSNHLSLSATGTLAYTSGADTRSLHLWQPGGDATQTALPAGVQALFWAPCATLLVAACKFQLIFVSGTGTVLAGQHIQLPGFSGVWGRHGLLCDSVVEGRRLLHFFAVRPGLEVQLQHVVALPDGLLPTSPLLLSPSQSHFAFCARLKLDTRVVVLPASPARAKAVALAVLGSSGPSPQASAHPLMRWLPDGSGHFDSVGQSCPRVLKLLQL